MFATVKQPYLFYSERLAHETLSCPLPARPRTSCDNFQPIPSHILSGLVSGAKDLGTKEGYTGYGAEQGKVWHLRSLDVQYAYDCHTSTITILLFNVAAAAALCGGPDANTLVQKTLPVCLNNIETPALSPAIWWHHDTAAVGKKSVHCNHPFLATSTRRSMRVNKCYPSLKLYVRHEAYREIPQNMGCHTWLATMCCIAYPFTKKLPGAQV